MAGDSVALAQPEAAPQSLATAFLIVEIFFELWLGVDSGGAGQQ
jgi:hypothetical protein